MNLLNTINSITDKLSDNPLVYTYIRQLLTGDQTEMRSFIKNALTKYKCKTIADICCGTGDFAVLTPKDGAYIGWDNNPSYIDFANKRFKNEQNISFSVADVLKSKLSNKKYDSVWLISTLHHMSDKDLHKLLPIARNMTGKTLIVADIIPNPPNILQKFFTRIDRGKHIRPEEEKLNLLKKYFKVVRTRLISTGSVVQFCIICEKKNA